MKILDGKLVSSEIKKQILAESQKLMQIGKKVSLSVILVGDDKASATYVKAKSKACEMTNIASNVYRLEKNTSEAELLKIIEKLNLDDSVDGILVQLPLPNHINSTNVINSINPLKDVDGFNPINFGRLFSGQNSFIPCTPFGIMKMLEFYDINVSGLNAVVIGRSNIVGKPMAALLLNACATICVTHSKTKNLAEICSNADLLIAALGKPKFVKSNMVKEGAIVIDVGINRLDDGKIVGDVDFDDVFTKCKYISPVPGGVGPMTIAMLLFNTIKSAKDRI